MNKPNICALVAPAPTNAKTNQSDGHNGENGEGDVEVGVVAAVTVALVLVPAASLLIAYLAVIRIHAATTIGAARHERLLRRAGTIAAAARTVLGVLAGWQLCARPTPPAEMTGRSSSVDCSGLVKAPGRHRREQRQSTHPVVGEAGAA